MNTIEPYHGHLNRTRSMKVGGLLHIQVNNSSHDHRIRSYLSTVWVKNPEYRRRCLKRERWRWPTYSNDGLQLPRSWVLAHWVGWLLCTRSVPQPTIEATASHRLNMLASA